MTQAALAADCAPADTGQQLVVLNLTRETAWAHAVTQAAPLTEWLRAYRLTGYEIVEATDWRGVWRAWQPRRRVALLLYIVDRARIEQARLN